MVGPLFLDSVQRHQNAFLLAEIEKTGELNLAVNKVSLSIEYQ